MTVICLRERSSRTATEPKGETAVTGLLRITEPKGGFLRKNDPAADRWFSRDVQAIAAATAQGPPTTETRPNRTSTS